MSTEYCCLNCGATEGEPIPGDTDTVHWYWTRIDHGRIGPHCSESCAASFTFPRDREARFTILEWSRLEFHRRRAEHLEVW